MEKIVKKNKSPEDGSEELAQALMRCAGTGIYIIRDGRFQYVNSLFQELTGYTEQELLGLYPLDLVHSEDREIVRKKAIGSLKGGNSFPYEYRFIKKDGGVIWVLERLTSTEYKGKRATAGSFMDITERKHLEHTILRSEERYRNMVEQMEDTYLETGLDGNYTFVNDAMCRALRYSKEELVGMNYRVIVAEEDAKAMYKDFSTVYRTGKPLKGLSYNLVRKDGTREIAELSVSPRRNQEGQIIGFCGIGRDVTERIRMEEALRQSEERYRTILAEIEEGYYEVDLAGNIKFVNKAACRQFGYSEEELIGSNYRAYVLKEDIKGVYKAWNKVYRTGEPLRSYPFATVRKDGTQIFVENSVSPLRDKAGKIVGFRAVSRDVTQRKQFEQKLADMATHDSLTGLPNRTLLSDRLTMGLALSRRSGNKLAVLMLDLDKFKVINDTLGHGAGDQLLKSVAERLTSVTRQSDTVARLGGDEFVLALPQVTMPADAARLAQRILDAFREPFIFDGHQLDVTTSIGIAVYPEDGKEIHILLKNADTAMYQAKEQGRDMYRFYSGVATKTGTKAQKSV